MIQHMLRQRVKDFVGEHGDLAIEKLDGEEESADRLIEALQSLPFLAEGKLVVIKNASSNKQFAEKFEGLLGSIPETNEIIFVEPRPDKRTSFYKLLGRRTGLREFKNLDEKELVKWLISEITAQKGQITGSDAEYLVQRVGSDQARLFNELRKLVAYNPEVTKSSIATLTEPAPQTTIFELLDAAFSGNHKKMLDIYEEQRQQKVEPQQILAMLAWQLHVLALIKTADNRRPEEIAKDAKLNPFVVRKSLNIAKKMTKTQLKELIAEALEIDIRLKTENIDADDALRHYLLAITS